MSKKEETLTIHQVAEMTSLSEHTLRYYEKIGLITHVARDASSNHRVYSKALVEHIKFLTCMRTSGLSIEEMRAHLQTTPDSSARSLKELLIRRKQELKDEMRYLAMLEKHLDKKIAYHEALERDDADAAARLQAEVSASATQLSATRKENEK